MELYAGSPIGAWGQVEDLVPGGLSLVVARRGVGKTALAVHAALQVLLRGQKVLHVALAETVDHVRAHYDEIVRVVAERTRLAAGSPLGEAAILVERNRTVHAFAGRPFDLEAVRRNLQVLDEAAQFRPTLLVVDGLSAEGADLGPRLEALAAFGREHGLAVVATLTSEEPGALRAPGALPAGVRLLTLDGRRGRMVLEVSGADPDAEVESLTLEPSTLFVAAAGAAPALADTAIAAVDATLYSGGALGAESAFGEAAARHGVHEVNFTFAGHLQARTRGRYELSPKELAMGDVSLQYVSRKLHRTYNDQGGLIRGVLQTIWHMVSRSRQVFVVGAIQPDGTVVGGTGWAVELARAWSRELWVFDQEKRVWFGWDGATWSPGTPLIRHPHLCGTGTRYLDDAGRAAIDDLFARSFTG